MTDIIPASTYLTHSELVQGANPIGRIQGTRYTTLAITPELQGHSFALPTVASPLNDPTISHASLIGQYNTQDAVFSQQVTSLYERQNNYADVAVGSTLNVSG